MILQLNILTASLVRDDAVRGAQGGFKIVVPSADETTLNFRVVMIHPVSFLANPIMRFSFHF